MPRMSINIVGAKELEKKLGGMEKNVARKIVKDVLRKAMKPLLADAKSRVQVKSGFLKKNLKIRTMKKKKHRYGVFVGVGQKWYVGKAFYGAFLEFGTSKMAARPFLRPAFDGTKKRVENIVKAGLKRAIESIGRKK